MNNICRPFVLYNDFLPPIREGHDRWDFLSFGYNDGITVEDDLLKENNVGFDFGKMWDYQVKHGKHIGNGCSSHILWGVRCEKEEKGCVKDADFWKEWKDNPKYPFLFIALLQGCYDMDEDKWYELEKSLTKIGSYEAITYRTFDNSDFILMVKCMKYEEGTKIISQFHYGTNGSLQILQGNSPVYSFTIASINKKFLVDKDLLESVQGSIPHAYIYVIERYPGSVSNIYQGIKDKLGNEKVSQRETVLGCNDEVIVINDVPWSKFLKFFQYNVKTSDPSFSKWLDSLIGITTIIGQPLEDVENEGQDYNVYKGDTRVNRELLSDILYKKCEKINFVDPRLETIKRNIYQTINSLRKFEETPVRDYLFKMMFLPLNMVLDIGQKVEKLYQEQFINSFYEFMKGLNLYAQNSDKSDRQFVQSIDLKIRIYNTPVKLNAFYNAFIFFTAQFLVGVDSLLNEQVMGQKTINVNDCKHDYEFFACPGIANNMQVKEMFKGLSDTKRLFLVEMPENQVYSPKAMMVMLAHEVGHFVGRNIRMRESRMKCAAKIMGKAVVEYIKRYLKDEMAPTEFSVIEDNYWECIEEKIKDNLEKFDENYENYLLEDKFHEKSQKNQNFFKDMLYKRRYHSELLKQVLIDGMKHIMASEENTFLEYICEKRYLYLLGEGDIQASAKKSQLKKGLQKKIDQLFMYEKWNGSTLSIFSIIDYLIYLFKECIADLIAILTLKLTLKDYLETVEYSINMQKHENRTEKTTIIDIRTGLVIYCMNHGSDSDFRWKDEQAKEVCEEANKNIFNLWKSTLSFMETYIGEQSVSFSQAEKEKYNTIDLLLDDKIITFIIEYLLGVKENFIRCKSGNLQEQWEQLHQMYELFETTNIVSVAENMQKYITKFLEEIEQKKNEEISKWKEKEKNQQQSV